MTPLRVAACQWQMRPARTFADFAAHATEVVAAAAAAGAALLVLPEYVTYELLTTLPAAAALTDRAMRAAFTAAFPPHLDSYLALFSDLAARHALTILAGSTWHAGEGDTHANSAFLVAPDGTVRRQTKLHVTPPEEAWAAARGADLLLTDIGPARVGVAICYDIEFPEVARTLAERGATLILTPSWTTTVRGAARVRLCAQARAIENGIFVASAPLIGTLGLPAGGEPLTGHGSAAIFAPIENRLGVADGILAAAPPESPDALAIADLDFRALHRARTRSEAPTWGHRRPDLYARWRSQSGE